MLTRETQGAQRGIAVIENFLTLTQVGTIGSNRADREYLQDCRMRIVIG